MSLETLMDSSQEIFQLNKDIISFKINKKDLKANDEPISISEDEIKVTNINYLSHIVRPLLSQNFKLKGELGINT